MTPKAPTCEICRKAKGTQRVRLSAFGALVWTCGKCRRPKKAVRR